MTVAKRTIKWSCTAEGSWQWLSGGAPHPSFPVTGDNVREGTIALPPNANYWFPCIDVVLQGVCTGNAYLRYFQENGVDQVQAMTCAQGKWIETATAGASYSGTHGDGGLNLLVQFA